MFIVVTGGSGSGKSAYAESLIVQSEIKKRYYIATMVCSDEESRQRIQRHRKMRAGKGFETLEIPIGLKNVHVPENSAVLLECMSNLSANEMFAGDKPGDAASVTAQIMKEIHRLKAECELLVVVTNEVFSDGRTYDEMTEEYLKCLGMINTQMAQIADEVTEVVYTIPIIHKKGQTR